MANTTSGTTTFDKTFAIDEIIEDAFERIGLRNVAGYQLKSARRSLNILFQEWGNRGIHYWEIGELDLDLIEGQAEYKFFRASSDGTSATSNPNGIYGISDVLEAQLRSNRTQTTQSDSPMTKVDRSTYAGFSNKLSKGTPNQYWVERFIDKVRIHVYPTPDSTNASKDMHFYYIKRIQEYIPILIKKYPNTEFTLSISLDGPKNIHDKVRNFVRTLVGSYWYVCQEGFAR